MPDRFKLRLRLWPTLAAVLGVAATMALGVWQIDRAAQKEQLQARLDRLSREPAVRIPASPVNPQDFLFRRVEVEGRFDPRHLIYLDNQIYRGEVGYDVVTPMEIGASGKYVLVNRGWVPWTGRRDRLPPVATPEGAVKIEGIAVLPARTFTLSRDTVEGRVWENLDLTRYHSLTGLDVQPIVIQQLTPLPDALVRDWPRPDAGADRNKGYAFQWFALALTILVIYLIVHVKRSPEAP